jgi:hypothetical protein
MTLQGGFLRRARTGFVALAAAVVFVVSWFYRFNDPGGQFAGLTDDHFFYVVRGWQILYGDLPVRDFADHGAPLHFYLAALVQVAFGRGTLSEVAFSVTVLAGAAALTFAAAARAAGSIAAALFAIAVHVLLGPRFYNYPKALVYAVAIPLLWRYLDRPGGWSCTWVAVIAVLGFLWRHDHGAFVTSAFLAALVLAGDLSWRDRLGHAARFAAVALALAAPYLLFIQLHGGLTEYFTDAFAWAARDRVRAPVIWPGLFDNSGGIPAAQPPATLAMWPIVMVRDNFVAWMYYLELALPLVVLALLASSRDWSRPDWPRARRKMAVVALLAIVLNAGFLRSPLEARLADPIVPHTILLAWVLAAAVAVSRRRGAAPAAAGAARQWWARLVRPATLVVATGMIAVLVAGLSAGIVERLERTRFIEPVRATPTRPASWRAGRVVERARDVSRALRAGWQPAARLRSREPSDQATLARYLNACTEPTDRILIQAYLPQVLALAGRAFAGGHADLRPGFFDSPEAQRLTVARLARQSVPVVLLESGDSYAQFRASFPLVTAYLDERYRLAGTGAFGGWRLQLFVRTDASPRGVFEPLDWPCFAGALPAAP